MVYIKIDLIVSFSNICICAIIMLSIDYQSYKISLEISLNIAPKQYPYNKKTYDSIICFNIS